jgi:hypothetical protein
MLGSRSTDYLEELSLSLQLQLELEPEPGRSTYAKER